MEGKIQEKKTVKQERRNVSSRKWKKKKRKQKESLSKFLIHFSADMHPEEKLFWREKANEGGR